MEHGVLFYLVPWVMAFVSALALLWFVTSVPYFRVRLERQEPGRVQQIHPRFYRLGGVMLIGIFLILLLGDRRLEWNASFVTLCVGSLAILIFSFADDLRHVAWPWHLSFQVLLGLLVFSSGMQLDVASYLDLGGGGLSPALAVLGVIGWVVLVMNAINWADGTDGLMPGTAFLSFGTLFLLAFHPEVNQPTIAILSGILSGLALGLLFFNWHPARILAGTGGAYFFGFTLAVLGLYAGMKVATLLIVLAVPVFDALFVVLRRLLLARSPFLPDEEHLHHLLLHRGWQPATIASASLVVTGLMTILALSIEGERKVSVFSVVGLLVLLLSFVLRDQVVNRSRTNRIS